MKKQRRRRRRKRIFWSKNQRGNSLDWKIQFDQIVFTLSLSVYTETAVHARVHARTKKKKNTFFVVVDFILT